MFGHDAPTSIESVPKTLRMPDAFSSELWPASWWGYFGVVPSTVVNAPKNPPDSDGVYHKAICGSGRSKPVLIAYGGIGPQY